MFAKLLAKGAVLVAFAVLGAGCSYGSVTDRVSGTSLGAAYIKVNQIDFSTVMGNSGPIVKSTDYQTSDTWASSMPGSNGNNGIWYLNPYGSKNSGDTKVNFIPTGWDRFKARVRDAVIGFFQRRIERRLAAA